MADYVGQQRGNYRVLHQIGRGGLANVYLGEHRYLKTPVAIKLLHSKVEQEEDLEQFLHEARTIAHLVHPNIIRVMDFGVEDATPFLVMNYAAGGTLRQHYLRGTQLDLTTLLPYLRQVGAALHCAHQVKLIHRDVKPENMLVGRNNEVLLSDFGNDLGWEMTPFERGRGTQEGICSQAGEETQVYPIGLIFATQSLLAHSRLTRTSPGPSWQPWSRECRSPRVDSGRPRDDAGNTARTRRGSCDVPEKMMRERPPVLL